MYSNLPHKIICVESSLQLVQLYWKNVYSLHCERDRLFLGVSQVAGNAEAVIFVLSMRISSGYLRNKNFIQFQFSDSRLWCILQHSLFPSSVVKLSMCTSFFHYLGKRTEANTEYLLLLPGAYWQSLICISEFAVRCMRLSTLPHSMQLARPPQTTHMLYSCLSFWKEAFPSVAEISWQEMVLVCSSIT